VVISAARGCGRSVAASGVATGPGGGGAEAGRGAAAAAAAAPAVGVKPDEVMATLEKLADLKAKGIVTQDEFDAKKAELLKKLV
jgi:predicted Zn-dependent peptidase